MGIADSAGMGVHPAIYSTISLAQKHPPNLEQVLSNLSVAISKIPTDRHTALDADMTSTSSGRTASDLQLASLYSCRAATLCQMERYREALFDSASAIARDDKALYHWPMGRALSGIRIWAEAVREFSIALGIQDKEIRTKIFLDRAIAYGKIKKREQAIGDYLRALQGINQKDSWERTTGDCHNGAIAETALRNLGVPVVPMYAREA